MPIPTTIDTKELRARLAFWRAPGVNPELLENCLFKFCSIQSFFARKNEVSRELTRLIEQADWRGADCDLKWLSHPDHFLLQQDDLGFPPLLKEIYDPPPFLFVRGDIKCLKAPQIALVGSRNPTYYGLQAAQCFATDLVNAGFMVTSGLALGIDAAAHEAALWAKGRTLAVLAIGLDAVYPKRHEKLAEKIIAQHGALVSEFGVGMPPLPGNFPRRNRLISGLSVGVVVIEATLKSGSLITARLAMEQCREVFAVPGSIFQPVARGCHALIKQGVKCAENIEDVLSELRMVPMKAQYFEPRQPLSMPKQAKIFKEPAVVLDARPYELLHTLSEIPLSFPALLEQLTWPAGILHAELMALIIDELVLQTVHGYVRVKESIENNF